MSPYILLMYEFSYTSEHVLTINQTKYVAEVSSFLKIKINYHKYINWFVRGKDTICSEDYSDGEDSFIDKETEVWSRKRCFETI